VSQHDRSDAVDAPVQAQRSAWGAHDAVARATSRSSLGETLGL